MGWIVNEFGRLGTRERGQSFQFSVFSFQCETQNTSSLLLRKISFLRLGNIASTTECLGTENWKLAAPKCVLGDHVITILPIRSSVLYHLDNAYRTIRRCGDILFNFLVVDND